MARFQTTIVLTVVVFTLILTQVWAIRLEDGNIFARDENFVVPPVYGATNATIDTQMFQQLLLVLAVFFAALVFLSTFAGDSVPFNIFLSPCIAFVITFCFVMTDLALPTQNNVVMGILFVAVVATILMVLEVGPENKVMARIFIVFAVVGAVLLMMVTLFTTFIQNKSWQLFTFGVAIVVLGVFFVLTTLNIGLKPTNRFFSTIPMMFILGLITYLYAETGLPPGQKGLLPQAFQS